MARFLASSLNSRLILSSLTNFRHLISIHRPCETPKISTLVRYNRTLVSRGMESRPSIPGSRSSSKRVLRATNSTDPTGSGGLGILIQNIPIWARVVLGSIFILALPFYKKILRIEDEVEKDVEAVAEVVEAVAQVTEKIAADVADVIPGDGRIKQLVVEAEHIAEEVAEDAEQAETFIHKVDEIKEEVEKLVESEKAELAKKESIEKEDTKPSKDPSIVKEDIKPSNLPLETSG